jgi:hypothetical protein
MLEREQAIFLNNGMSSMLTNGREIQERVNSTNASACMLKEISILSQEWDQEDTSIFSPTDTSISRLETVERLKPSGSIKRL